MAYNPEFYGLCFEFDGSAGAGNSATSIDNSALANPVILLGGVTAVSDYPAGQGNYSLNLTGGLDGVSIPHNASQTFGSSSFTLEGWFKSAWTSGANRTLFTKCRFGDHGRNCLIPSVVGHHLTALMDNKTTSGISTTVKEYGNTSYKRLTTASPVAQEVVQTKVSASYYLGAQDWTIEISAYFTAVNTTVGLIGITSSTGSLSQTLGLLVTPATVPTSSTVSLTYNAATYSTGGTTYTININTWYKFAVVKSGVSPFTYRIFMDGVLKDTFTTVVDFGLQASSGGQSKATVGGCIGGSPFKNMIGYLDEFRITKGVARYSATYTPASAPFPDSIAGDASFASVVLLNHFDEYPVRSPVKLFQRADGLLTAEVTKADGTVVRLTATSPTSNVWSHVALVRDGTDLTLYIDGAQVAQSVGGVVGALLDNTEMISIGCGDTMQTDQFTGYIHSMSLTNSVRYTTSFTPGSLSGVGNWLELKTTAATAPSITDAIKDLQGYSFAKQGASPQLIADACSGRNTALFLPGSNTAQASTAIYTADAIAISNVGDIANNFSAYPRIARRSSSRGIPWTIKCIFKFYRLPPPNGGVAALFSSETTPTAATYTDYSDSSVYAQLAITNNGTELTSNNLDIVIGLNLSTSGRVTTRIPTWFNVQTNTWYEMNVSVLPDSKCLVSIDGVLIGYGDILVNTIYDFILAPTGKTTLGSIGERLSGFCGVIQSFKLEYGTNGPIGFPNIPTDKNTKYTNTPTKPTSVRRFGPKRVDAFSPALAPFTAVTVAGAQLTAQTVTKEGGVAVNVRYSGAGVVSGNTLKEGILTPTIPVNLHERTTGELVMTTMSATNGYYEFMAVSMDYTYYVVGLDPIKSYNAVIQDNITPVRVP